MKALRFDRIGSLDALSYVDLPVPEPKPDEVRVRVHAAGINPSDIKNVLGQFPYTTVPRTPGRDFAGVVVDGPPELLGQEVWGSEGALGFTRDGTHAEYVLVPEDSIAPKPANLSFAEAASCGIPYLTALEALDRTGVGPDTTIVIIGLGAVGRAAVDLARGRGARILVGVRRAEQVASLRDQGIAAIALGSPEGFAAAVRDHFPGGADVVFDTTGFWLPAAVSALAEGGSICVIAAPEDGHVRVPVLDLYRRGASIIGVNSLMRDTAGRTAVLDKLRASFEEGVLPPPSGMILRPLDEGVATYRAVSAGGTDKFILTIDHPMGHTRDTSSHPG